ncbi:MAG TPA: type VII secretion target [Pseudonocardiaceae bacterium]|nr:type VII secretion target [Pseudonocardiaceae bacterium]
MHGGFLVDVGALGQLISALSEAAERMHSATDRLRAASAAELGSGDLDHAAADFQSRWDYGIGKVSQASEKMTDSLREAAALYEQTDQTVAALFRTPSPAAHVSPISRALDAGMAQ